MGEEPIPLDPSYIMWENGGGGWKGKKTLPVFGTGGPRFPVFFCRLSRYHQIRLGPSVRHSTALDLTHFGHTHTSRVSCSNYSPPLVR